MLNKFAIDFDPTTPTLDDTVGSYLVGLEGSVVTSSDLGGGKRGLDVVIGSIMLGSDSGVFLEDSAAASGDKGQSILLVRQDTLASSTSTDGDYGNFKSNAKGELYIHDVDSLASLVLINSDTTAINGHVATIDTNIASIVKTEDAAAGDGYKGVAMFGVRNDTNAALVGTDGDFSALSLDALSRVRAFATLDLASLVADDAASTENSILIGSVAHDVTATALSAVSTAGDKANLASDKYRRSLSNNAASVGWGVAAVSLGTSATRLDATPQPGRTKITVQNLAKDFIEIGPDNTVTIGAGVYIPKVSERDFEFSGSLQVWGIANTAASSIRVIQQG